MTSPHPPHRGRANHAVPIDFAAAHRHWHHREPNAHGERQLQRQAAKRKTLRAARSQSPRRR